MLVYFLASSLFILGAACGGKKLAPPAPGWFLNGQPLASAQNEALPAGATLYLAEKFTLEAVTDSVVRVVLDKAGVTQVHLLYGTGVISRQDAQFAVTLHANGNRIHLQGSRLLLQNHVGSTRFFLIEGAAEIEEAKEKKQLSSQAINFFEMQAGQKTARKLALRDMPKFFPELARARVLIAIK